MHGCPEVFFDVVPDYCAYVVVVDCWKLLFEACCVSDVVFLAKKNDFFWYGQFCHLVFGFVATFYFDFDDESLFEEFGDVG